MKSFFKTVQVVDIDKVMKAIRKKYPDAFLGGSMQVCAIYASRQEKAKILGTGWTDEEAWLSALDKVSKKSTKRNP